MIEDEKQRYLLDKKALEMRQQACPHRKGNGYTALAGQHVGFAPDKKVYVCQWCLKVFTYLPTGHEDYLPMGFVAEVRDTTPEEIEQENKILKDNNVTDPYQLRDKDRSQFTPVALIEQIIKETERIIKEGNTF